MTRAARLLLTLLLGVPALVLSAPSPAQACSCAAGGVQQYAEWSDAVFVATLRGPLREGTTGSVEAAATVATVYDGDVAAEVTISTGAQSSACGLTGLQAGETWLFYAASDSASSFQVSLCGGSTRAEPGRLARVERVLGAGRSVTPTADRGAEEAPANAAGPPGGDDGPAPWAVGALGAGVAALGAGGFLVARRRAVSRG
jgi:hypothetical protein